MDFSYTPEEEAFRLRARQWLEANAPRDIPDRLTVNIADLAIGDVIRVGDLTLPSGVRTDVDPEAPVVVAAGAAIEPEPEVAEGEGEEGEGAPAAVEGGGQAAGAADNE